MCGGLHLEDAERVLLLILRALARGVEQEDLEREPGTALHPEGEEPRPDLKKARTEVIRAIR